MKLPKKENTKRNTKTKLNDDDDDNVVERIWRRMVQWCTFVDCTEEGEGEALPR